ncbi:hypothetical protein TNCV_3180681 [Trichonephila clavipes]|nr:hypothetical protein TNCV_3180681 [Trichonephila clavipes]
MCIKLKNDIPVCQRARRLSCSDNPSPMKTVCNAPENLPALAVETEEKERSFSSGIHEEEEKDVPLRTADSQAGRCGMQPKAIFARRRSKSKPKLKPVDF